ncbi:hypothetical protein DC522_29230 [Microvirga sp. KLBC 81]|uniref:Uncharacterized protein n=1 Tax=Microvirga vignae TaxID=1225564 RepID=A0A0H1RBL5_9HYPH|nr:MULTISPECIES: BrnA antitoxin family protein [Microvirga]KLK89977.1 hypothetical protein AA309_28345 [Microvirga vignae]PVE20973.1 hypothetical protein DC522_29230 [Microvirga sp. KLBC 81]
MIRRQAEHLVLTSTRPEHEKESCKLHIDLDVLAYFPEDGLGWQERISAALRRAAGKSNG